MALSLTCTFSSAQQDPRGREQRRPTLDWRRYGARSRNARGSKTLRTPSLFSSCPASGVGTLAWCALAGRKEDGRNTRKVIWSENGDKSNERAVLRSISDKKCRVARVLFISFNFKSKKKHSHQRTHILACNTVKPPATSTALAFSSRRSKRHQRREREPSQTQRSTRAQIHPPASSRVADTFLTNGTDDQDGNLEQRRHR